jgi:hypothetical protein
MPKKDDAPELGVCDACGREMPTGGLPDLVGYLRYCADCAERRADDPAITVQGRTMPLSELKAQAEDDKDLAAALDGDTVKSQIEAAGR